MNKYMKAAIQEADFGISQNEGGPFGAIIVKDGLIIGRGHNEVVKQKDPTCHGEIMAIHDACRTLDTFDLTGCELYTTGEPCPMCRGAILWANISKVYFGCSTLDTEIIGFRDRAFYHRFENHELTDTTELDRDECLKLYERYRKLNRKTTY
ncbi:MAG: nucleoside deaminase [Erysipelotrichia bacterium]|nr:nucleoside deaminase [Erysipelotrichia bacterium]